MFDPFAADPDDDRELPNPYRGKGLRHLELAAVALQEQRTRLDADEADLLAEVERRRLIDPLPVRDAGGWLQQQTGIARSTARARGHVAAQLMVMPAFADALAAGKVTFDHCRAVADHADSANRDQVLDDQLHLLRLASGVGADTFRDRLAEWARDIDAEREAGMSDLDRQRSRRKVRRWRGRDGMNNTLLSLDDEADAVIAGLLRDLVHDELRAEHRNKLYPDRERTNVQRWADAALEMALRARGADALSKRKARPTILALAEADLLWDQLKVNGFCELADGTKITARQLRRLACEADIISMILDSQGAVLDQGRKVRLATEPQRHALRAMHETCAIEGCDVRFEWCEIHHLKPWERKGLTNLDNLVPLCSFHHHIIHGHDWDITRLPSHQLRLGGIVLPPQPRPHLSRRIHGRPPDRVPAR